MTTAKHIPKFEEGAIAFRWTSIGEILQAWKVFGFRLTPKGERQYRLWRDGFERWEPASELLTGWEDGFPGYDMVDWGQITRSDSDFSEPDDEPLEAEEKELEESFVNEDWLSDLADRYELSEFSAR